MNPVTTFARPQFVITASPEGLAVVVKAETAEPPRVVRLQPVTSLCLVKA